MSDPLPEIDRLLLRAGREEEVIEAMVAVYQARLTRLAEAILHDHQEAEDAVQQSFISAALQLERYQPGTDFTAWIYTITVNACRGALRRRKARQALTRLLGWAGVQSEPVRPETVLIKNEANRHLWQAVEHLNEKQRLVVLLRYQEGLSIQEIAQVVSVPEPTVYTRLYSAFRNLRSELVYTMPAQEDEEAWQVSLGAVGMGPEDR